MYEDENHAAYFGLMDVQNLWGICVVIDILYEDKCLAVMKQYEQFASRPPWYLPGSFVDDFL